MAITKELLQKYKVDIENETIIAERVYENAVKNYMEELDAVIEEMESIIADIESGEITSYANEDLERITLKIPILMYRIGSDLERVGVRLDVTEAIKIHRQNDSLLKATGTVPEKKAKSENEVIYEQVLEDIYRRVYKQIDRRLDYIDNLYNSIKKVISLRIAELEVFRRENAQNNKVGN